jgi:hypothetical protein
VFYKVEGAEILVMGNDAERFAEVFHVETRRPMKLGTLNPQEPHSLTVVKHIIERLLGQPGTEGQKVVFSVPAPLEQGEDGVPYHQACVQQVIGELGYEATAIEEGLAVVFGELSDSNFTGIGISCGSGLCNVCLAVLSVPVIRFSVPRAGDYIDNHAAMVTGDLAIRLRVQKEKAFHLNGFSPDRVQNALSVYYKEMIAGLVESLRRQISSAQRLPKLEQSIPLVLAGGTTMPKGFLEYFNNALRANGLPVKLSEVRVSADPLNSTARGALMGALC